MFFYMKCIYAWQGYVVSPLSLLCRGYFAILNTLKLIIIWESFSFVLFFYKFFIIFMRLLDGSSALKSAPAGLSNSLLLVFALSPLFFVRLIQTLFSSFFSVMVTLFVFTWMRQDAGSMWYVKGLSKKRQFLPLNPRIFKSTVSASNWH